MIGYSPTLEVIIDVDSDPASGISILAVEVGRVSIEFVSPDGFSHSFRDDSRLAYSEILDLFTAEIS